MKLLDLIRDGVRGVVAVIARILNTLTGGQLHPNTITIISLVTHVPIAWFISQGHLVLGGVWLIVFGLFDALDGELARLQKRASAAGMFLDSVTDRVKEVILYMGIGAFMVANAHDAKCNYDLKACFIDTVPGIETTYLVVFVIAVLGASMLTSYLNAWGEAVLSRAGVNSPGINKTFRGGLASFELRMALIVLGLLTGFLFPALLLIALLAGLTIARRMYKVFRELSRVQS